MSKAVNLSPKQRDIALLSIHLKIKNMFGKGTKAYSIFTSACPKCHNDQMYVNKNPYVLKETMKMHENCSSCGFRYKVEPNFFFGAMFVSYGVSVLVGILIFLLCYFAFKMNLLDIFITIFAGLIVLTPLITRISRNIYINIFVSYNKDAAKKHVST